MNMQILLQIKKKLIERISRLRVRWL